MTAKRHTAPGNGLPGARGPRVPGDSRQILPARDARWAVGRPETHANGPKKYEIVIAKNDYVPLLAFISDGCDTAPHTLPALLRRLWLCVTSQHKQRLSRHRSRSRVEREGAIKRLRIAFLGFVFFFVYHYNPTTCKCAFEGRFRGVTVRDIAVTVYDSMTGARCHCSSLLRDDWKALSTVYSVFEFGEQDT